jgi:hypothetical protein
MKLKMNNIKKKLKKIKKNINYIKKNCIFAAILILVSINNINN